MDSAAREAASQSPPPERGAASTRRRAVEAALAGVVREHRFTIAVVFPVVGAVLLVASAEGLVPAPLAYHPLLLLAGTAVLRLPLVAGLAPLVDRRAGLALLAASAYAYAVEFVGLRTGLPYGEFEYLVDLGPAVAGVPVGLPLFFVPLVVDAALLALLVLPSLTRRMATRVPTVVAVVLAMDLVLDPGAVAVGFWAYPDGGAYYGVPASNYAGWLLSATVATVCVEAAFERSALLARLDECEFLLDDLVSFALLWGAVAAVYGNWIPALVAAALLAALVHSGRFDVPRPRWWDAVAARDAG